MPGFLKLCLLLMKSGVSGRPSVELWLKLQKQKLNNDNSEGCKKTMNQKLTKKKIDTFPHHIFPRIIIVRPLYLTDLILSVMFTEYEADLLCQIESMNCPSAHLVPAVNCM